MGDDTAVRALGYLLDEALGGAGETNHLRSILGTDDGWRFIQLGFG